MKYTGLITMHSEMCCGQWPQFHDNRGLHGDKNQFWNWDYTINFGKHTKIQRLFIWDNDGVILYDGPWNFFAYYDQMPMSKEVHPDYWLSLFWNGHMNCEIETDEVLEADKVKTI